MLGQNFCQSVTDQAINFSVLTASLIKIMAKHTQAHLPRRMQKSWPEPLKQREREKMEYYMGAKLIEIGVDPKVTIYRWSVKEKGNEEEWTCSAYWGESKEKVLQDEQS